MEIELDLEFLSVLVAADAGFFLFTLSLLGLLAIVTLVKYCKAKIKFHIKKYSNYCFNEFILGF